MSRTDCGNEVEYAIIKELLLQGFPEEITRKVLATYNIDAIIFEHIMKEASVTIDDLHKAERGQGMNATMCPWCGDKYEARAWDAPHNCKEEGKE